VRSGCFIIELKVSFPMSADSTSFRETPLGDDFRDAAEEIEFLAAVREAEADVVAGELVTHEQVGIQLEAWLAE
jgi:hypothetical protein